MLTNLLRRRRLFRMADGEISDKQKVLRYYQNVTARLWTEGSDGVTARRGHGWLKNNATGY